MRTNIQRVSEASVTVNGNKVASINGGLMILLGIEASDSASDIKWLASKICSLRIFNDDKGVMNLSVREIGGEILLVSQFTLQALTQKGNRPSFIRAAKPDLAIPIYEAVIKQLESELGKRISTGIFAADMQVNLTNDGPVTIWIDTKNKE